MNFTKHGGAQRMWRQPNSLTITYQDIRAHRDFDHWKNEGNCFEASSVTITTPPSPVEAKTSLA
ncbi:hypothetical protein [Bradyrhizobium roseum]|uniref:hypothetical protein n=1 Tax=Bradyrhizobium roseum TaxID=3056648 RepID=UPI00260B3F8D|nr:hypothetical protein [Bradyrhizobium roseus]WKA32252.1 hypothetical protein QUH67_09765 [Bradyrhizobium roseus]